MGKERGPSGKQESIKEKWAYLRIAWNSHGVGIQSTEKMDFSWVKKHIKSASIEEGQTPKDEPLAWNYRIRNLQNKDSEVALWIINSLCTNGWEPFAVLGETDRDLRGHLAWPAGGMTSEWHFKRLFLNETRGHIK